MSTSNNSNSSNSNDKEEYDSASLQSNMTQEKLRRDIFKDYEITKELGLGSMGAVSRCRKREDALGGSAYKSEKKAGGLLGMLGVKTKKKHVPDEEVAKMKDGPRSKQEYALKTIQLGRVTAEFLDELRNEIGILRTLDHPNIVKLYEVYENRKQIYLVMEICSGGDLFARNPYPESEAAKITGALLSAVSYMHKKNVVHRDLKYENIMFENTSPSAQIKVIDFGLSKKFLPGDKYMTEGVGTIYTMAPQVLQGVYTSQADLWSVGVISYMLLSNTKPFYHRKRRYVIDKIMRCSYNFESSAWSGISTEAKKFVSSLLRMDPRERLTADEALQHKWLSNEYNLSDRRPSESFMDDVQENILSFGKAGEFKKLALQVIAHKSSSEEIMKLREAFDQYDKGNDGFITLSEFKEALAKFNYSDEQMDEMFQCVDIDHSGLINYTEFLAASLEAHGRIEEDRLAEAFDRMDSDNTGYISRKNLKQLLGDSYTPEKVETFFKEADIDKDGKIRFPEFIKAIKKRNSSFLGQVVDDSVTEEEGDLLDTDAVIPGGKFDS